MHLCSVVSMKKFVVKFRIVFTWRLNITNEHLIFDANLHYCLYVGKAEKFFGNVVLISRFVHMRIGDFAIHLLLLHLTVSTSLYIHMPGMRFFRNFPEFRNFLDLGGHSRGNPRSGLIFMGGGGGYHILCVLADRQQCWNGTTYILIINLF